MERLQAAAAECFRELGLTAPVTEIARRAGVSPGTLYNLFGSREGLIDEVTAGVAGSQLDVVLANAEAANGPWKKFAAYVEGLCELQASDPGICDVLVLRCPGAPRATAVFDKAQDAGARYVEQAHAAGELRSDFAFEDLFFILGANALLVRTTEAVSPGSWRRGVALFLQGLQVAPEQPLPAKPLTSEQLRVALTLLPGASWGVGRPPNKRQVGIDIGSTADVMEQASADSF